MKKPNIAGRAKDGTVILKQVRTPGSAPEAAVIAAVRKVKRARMLALDQLVSRITSDNLHGES